MSLKSLKRQCLFLAFIAILLGGVLVQKSFASCNYITMQSAVVQMRWSTNYADPSTCKYSNGIFYVGCGECDALSLVVGQISSSMTSTYYAGYSGSLNACETFGSSGTSGSCYGSSCGDLKVYQCTTQVEADSLKCALNPDADGCTNPCTEAIAECNKIDGAVPHFQVYADGYCHGYCDVCNSDIYLKGVETTRDLCCSKGLGFNAQCQNSAVIPSEDNDWGASGGSVSCTFYDGILTPPGCEVTEDESSSSTGSSSSAESSSSEESSSSWLHGGDESSSSVDGDGDSSSSSEDGEGTSSGSEDPGGSSSSEGDGGGGTSSGGGTDEPGEGGSDDWEYDYRDSLHRIIKRLDWLDTDLVYISRQLDSNRKAVVSGLNAIADEIDFWGRMQTKYASKGVIILDSIRKYDSLATVLGLHFDSLAIFLDSERNHKLDSLMGIMAQEGGFDSLTVEGIDSVLSLLGYEGSGLDSSKWGSGGDDLIDEAGSYGDSIGGVADSSDGYGYGDSSIWGVGNCEGEECCVGDSCFGFSAYPESLETSIARDYDSLPGQFKEAFDSAKTLTFLGKFDSTLLADLGASIPNTNTCPEECVTFSNFDLGKFGEEIGWTGKSIDFGICSNTTYISGMNVLQFIRLIARIITAFTCLAIAGWEVASTRGRIGL